MLLLLGPAKPVLRIEDERAAALSYFPGVCRCSVAALLSRRFFNFGMKGIKKEAFRLNRQAIEGGNTPISCRFILKALYYTLSFRSMIWAVTTYITAAKAKSNRLYSSIVLLMETVDGMTARCT